MMLKHLPSCMNRFTLEVGNIDYSLNVIVTTLLVSDMEYPSTMLATHQFNSKNSVKGEL